MFESNQGDAVIGPLLADLSSLAGVLTEEVGDYSVAAFNEIEVLQRRKEVQDLVVDDVLNPAVFARPIII